MVLKVQHHFKSIVKHKLFKREKVLALLLLVIFFKKTEYFQIEARTLTHKEHLIDQFCLPVEMMLFLRHMCGSPRLAKDLTYSKSSE